MRKTDTLLHLWRSRGRRCNPTMAFFSMFACGQGHRFILVVGSVLTIRNPLRLESYILRGARQMGLRETRNKSFMTTWDGHMLSENLYCRRMGCLMLRFIRLIFQGEVQ